MVPFSPHPLHHRPLPCLPQSEHPHRQVRLQRRLPPHGTRRTIHRSLRQGSLHRSSSDIWWIPTWCLFSEMVTNLANEIAICNEWDPATLRSPSQPITPVPKLDNADGSLFATVQTTAVAVPVRSTIKTDGFIDDLILVFLDTPTNRERAPHCVPLAVRTTSRPPAGPTEPVPRCYYIGLIQ
jgi:hypothetical protein